MSVSLGSGKESEGGGGELREKQLGKCVLNTQGSVDKMHSHACAWDENSCLDDVLAQSIVYQSIYSAEIHSNQLAT